MVKVFTFLLLAMGLAGVRPKALFYLTRDAAGVQSFLAHADKIGSTSQIAGSSLPSTQLQKP